MQCIADDERGESLWAVVLKVIIKFAIFAICVMLVIELAACASEPPKAPKEVIVTNTVYRDLPGELTAQLVYPHPVGDLVQDLLENRKALEQWLNYANCQRAEAASIGKGLPYSKDTCHLE